MCTSGGRNKIQSVASAIVYFHHHLYTTKNRSHGHTARNHLMVIFLLFFWLVGWFTLVPLPRLVRVLLLPPPPPLLLLLLMLLLLLLNRPPPCMQMVTLHKQSAKAIIQCCSSWPLRLLTLPCPILSWAVWQLLARSNLLLTSAAAHVIHVGQILQFFKLYVFLIKNESL